MELKTGIYAKQSIVITSQVIQAIRLLQYGQDDLRDYLTDQAERNPLIEVVAGSPAAALAGESIQPRAPGGEVAAPPRAGQNGAPAAWGGRNGSGRASGSGEAGNLEEFCASSVSLKDHLHSQAGMSFRDPAERMIAAEIIDSLESDGYLRRGLDEVAGRLGAERGRVEAVLARIQGFDPSGVAARDLAECLAIQLREKDRLDPAMQALLRNLGLLASYDVARLSEICGVDREDIADMACEIRALDPRPGRRFEAEPIQPALPDVLVATQSDGSCSVELNSDLLPRILVNRQYCARITTDRMGAQDRRFLMDCLKSANWLSRNLDQRAQTILKVATEVVARQAGFFRHGVEHLRPMCLKDVADTVGIHESTVCRAISNKYMMTSRGMFELRYFFSNSIAAVDGGEELSSETVRHKISALIHAETATTVLADDAIVNELRKSGIHIARRTIAKYRSMMNIPPSLQRRRRKEVENLRCG